MLKVKSFDITEDAKINELLTNYRLAEGAHILVSEGKICVPYEDGLEPNVAQKKISILEQRNGMKKQLELIAHSQEVLRIQAEDARKEIKRLEAEIFTPGSKEAYDKRRDNESEIKRLENVATQHENVIIQNKAEIVRLEANVNVFDKTLSSLK